MSVCPSVWSSLEVDSYFETATNALMRRIADIVPMTKGNVAIEVRGGGLAGLGSMASSIPLCPELFTMLMSVLFQLLVCYFIQKSRPRPQAQKGDIEAFELSYPRFEFDPQKVLGNIERAK